MNQPGLDSCSQQQEKEHDRESVIDVWLGADPVLRQALAARLLQQWQQEAEYLLAQRHYRKAIEDTDRYACFHELKVSIAIKQEVVLPLHDCGSTDRSWVHGSAPDRFVVTASWCLLM
jgi:hypothetical protein